MYSVRVSKGDFNCAVKERTLSEATHRAIEWFHELYVYAIGMTDDEKLEAQIPDNQLTFNVTEVTE